jgi:WD40 repeat protein
MFRSPEQQTQEAEGLLHNWALKAARPFKLGRRPFAAAFSGGSDFLAIGEGDQVEEWDLTKPEEPKRLQLGIVEKNAIIRSVAVSPRGDLFAAGGLDATVWVFDRASGKPLVTYKAQGIPFRLMFDPDSRYLVAAVGNDRKVAAVGNDRKDVGVGRTLSLYDEGSKIQLWMLPAPAPAARK